ncbi:Polysaccharide lyase, partial [Globisporangium splendens]
MHKSFSTFIVAVCGLTAAITTDAFLTGDWSVSNGSVLFDTPFVVTAGSIFDGEMKTYERSNVKCSSDEETGKATAVFLVEPGATLKNVIICKDQSEGVHCEQNDCIIENVWWDDVCEDTLTIKGGSASSVSKVIGGGARSADDKVVQHNGYGSVSIDGFYVQDLGKLYRACGNCGVDITRHVSVSNVYAVNPTASIVTANKNYNDEATLQNVTVVTSKKKLGVCV